MIWVFAVLLMGLECLYPAAGGIVFWGTIAIAYAIHPSDIEEEKL